MKSINSLSFASSEMVNNATAIVGGTRTTSNAFGTKRPELVVCLPSAPATAGLVVKATLGVRHR